MLSAFIQWTNKKKVPIEREREREIARVKLWDKSQRRWCDWAKYWRDSSTLFWKCNRWNKECRGKFSMAFPILCVYNVYVVHSKIHQSILHRALELFSTCIPSLWFLLILFFRCCCCCLLLFSQCMAHANGNSPSRLQKPLWKNLLNIHFAKDETHQAKQTKQPKLE